MKKVEITLRNKKSNITQKFLCHHYLADKNAYYLEGVKGHNAPFGLAFNKAEWERI